MHGTKLGSWVGLAGSHLRFEAGSHVGLAGFCLECSWDPGWDWGDPTWDSRWGPMWEVPKSRSGSHPGQTWDPRRDPAWHSRWDPMWEVPKSRSGSHLGSHPGSHPGQTRDPTRDKPGIPGGIGGIRPDFFTWEAVTKFLPAQ